MFRVGFIWLMGLALSGCVTAPVDPPKGGFPLAEQYAPINFSTYAGEYVSTYDAQVVDFMTTVVVDSGRFSDVQTGFNRWPITVHMNWKYTQDTSGLKLIGIMISSASLLIIPAPYTEEHSYEFKVVSGSHLLAEYHYSVQVDTALSLFHRPIRDRQNAATTAVKRFYSDLERDGIIPTMGELQGQTKQNQKHGI